MKAKELREIDYRKLVDKESSLRQVIFQPAFSEGYRQLAKTASIGRPGRNWLG